MATVNSGKVVLFGTGGPVGASAITSLKNYYTLRVTDLRPMKEVAASPPQNPRAPIPEVLDAPHENRVVDITDYEQVLAACEGMDAAINLSVLRPHPVLAFHVNMIGAYNVAKAYKKGILKDGTEGSVNGGVIGFFSLEMSAEQLAARILSEAAEIPSENIRRGDMTEKEFRRFVDAAKELESCPLFIDDTPALPISQLAARARRLKRKHGLDVMIVDYLQLVRPASSKDSRVNEVSEITQGMKAIAKELNIPVIALSQLSRQVESRDDKRPQLSDLRESGSIEQDADVVMFVFREEYYKEREKPSDQDLENMAKWQSEMEHLHGRAELIIGKQRHGPIGTIELSFEGQFTRFGNIAKAWQNELDR